MAEEEEEEEDAAASFLDEFFDRSEYAAPIEYVPATHRGVCCVAAAMRLKFSAPLCRKCWHFPVKQPENAAAIVYQSAS